MSRSFRVFALLIFLSVFVSSPLPGQDVKIPPTPGRWVTDSAGFLSPATVSSLDGRLQAFERQTGHQVLVYVGNTTGGVPIRDWGIKVFEAWKVGRKGIDDGLIVFIMAEDRQASIEVGYGLEEKVPDVLAFRVIDRILIPGFQRGERDAAVTDAVGSLLGFITGEAPPEDLTVGGTEADRRPPTVINKIFVAVAVIFFIILFITNPSLALWLLFSILSGGRGGGGGGGRGGGGFRGGGGRAGGGGASGSW